MASKKLTRLVIASQTHSERLRALDETLFWMNHVLDSPTPRHQYIHPACIKEGVRGTLVELKEQSLKTLKDIQSFKFRCKDMEFRRKFLEYEIQALLGICERRLN